MRYHLLSLFSKEAASLATVHLQEGVVVAVRPAAPGSFELDVLVNDRLRPALLYEQFTPRARIGDTVTVNTTAVDLGLGTGGVDFVVHVAGRSLAKDNAPCPGHIVKLRYTPLQFPVAAVEEEDSPHHEVMRDAAGLAGLPVVIAELHSHVAPAAAALRLAFGSDARLVYIMTDGGALPVAFSRLVHELHDGGFIDATITVGHAFGGDLEAVNLFSGLLAARNVLQADAAIVAMGPGVVGTGTRFGTTAILVGQHADAVATLDGRAFAVPRISFADTRRRHAGVSDHTLTAFGTVARESCTIVIPKMGPAKLRLVQEQLAAARIPRRHRLQIEQRGERAIDVLHAAGIRLRSMGREYRHDPTFFLAAAATGFAAAGATIPTR